jgi:hypothetical protein
MQRGPLRRTSHARNSPSIHEKIASFVGASVEFDEVRSGRSEEHLTVFLSQSFEECCGSDSVKFARHIVKEQERPNPTRVHDGIDLRQLECQYDGALLALRRGAPHGHLPEVECEVISVRTDGERATNAVSNSARP